MISFEANWIGVLVATVIGMVVSGIWYAPPVMGNRWMAYIGKTRADIDAEGGRAMATVIALLGAALTAYTLALLLHMTGITGIGESIGLALIVWIGLVFRNSWMGDTFEKRPIGLTILNNLNHGNFAASRQTTRVAARFPPRQFRGPGDCYGFVRSALLRRRPRKDG